MIRCILVPELGRELLRPDFLRDHPPGAMARLVTSFPSTTATIEATLCTGQPADRHEVLFEGESPRGASLLRSGIVPADAFSTDLLLGADPLTLLRWDGLEPDGDGLERLESTLREFLSSRPMGLILIGAPCSATTTATIEIPSSLVERNGWSVRRAKSIALIEGVSEIDPQAKDALLETPGIERVLGPHALDLWHAPSGRGTLLLAEPGWSFESGPTTTGRHDGAEERAEPVVVAWDPRSAASLTWPSAVHDWRIAPTVVRAAEGTTPAAFDDPLPWPGTLRC